MGHVPRRQTQDIFQLKVVWDDIPRWGQVVQDEIDILHEALVEERDVFRETAHDTRVDVV
jgi:hypothetical protein